MTEPRLPVVGEQNLLFEDPKPAGTGPRRVRVQGDLYHGRVPEGAVYIGRAAPGLSASPFRNPFKVAEYGAEALPMFARYLDDNPGLVELARRELAGKDLACWCKIGEPCHGDEWLRRLAAAQEADHGTL